ncbi:hypothetical protein BN126_1604 [Cronobacter sakazakii 680]|nr:hypothetical protein BN126_1604 [Cronobacter sakazakii 680]
MSGGCVNAPGGRMTNEYEYAERFADLMEDMQGDGVDA